MESQPHNDEEVKVLPTASNTSNPGYDTINDAETKKLQAKANYIEFNKWCKDNGCINPKIDYPVVYDKDLIGVAANSRIKIGEALLYIPVKLFLSVEKAYASEIGHIFRAHKDMFLEHSDGDFLVLTVFAMYEKKKGDQSRWGPWFKVMPPTDLPAFWSDEEVKAIEDPEVLWISNQMKRGID